MMKLLSLISDHLLLCVFLSLLWDTTDSTTTITATVTTTVTAGQQSTAKTETTTRLTTNLLTATTWKPTPLDPTIQTTSPTTQTTQKFTSLAPTTQTTSPTTQTTQKFTSLAPTTQTTSPTTQTTQKFTSLAPTTQTTSPTTQTTQKFTSLAPTTQTTSPPTQTTQKLTSLAPTTQTTSPTTQTTQKFTSLAPTTQTTSPPTQTTQKFTSLANTTQTTSPLAPKLQNTTSQAQTSPTPLTSTEQKTTSTTTKPSPDNVDRVNVTTQNENSITLMWEKVNDILTYILQYDSGNIVIGKNDMDGCTTSGASVTCVVSSLTAGTNYNFTLFTVFENVNSSGYNFTAPTVPPVVPWVSVTERFTNSITLEWENMNEAWQYQLQINGDVSDNVSESSSDTIRKVVTSLQPGTEYDFNLTTVFAGLISTAYENFTVTAIDCASADWKVTNSSIKAKIEGLFSNTTARNGSNVHDSEGRENVSFTGLYPGATYNISLVYEKSSRVFLQCEHKLTILPPNLNAHCEYWAAGYSVLIKWTDPEGEWTNAEVNVTGKTHTVASPKTEIIINGFQPAKKYKVSVTSLSGVRRSSEPHVFYCQTDPRGSFVLRLFRHLVVFSPYCFSTGLLLSIYWSRKTANKPDVSMEMTKCDGGGDELYEDHDDATVLGTEHDF